MKAGEERKDGNLCGKTIYLESQVVWRDELSGESVCMERYEGIESIEVALCWFLLHMM